MARDSWRLWQRDDVSGRDVSDYREWHGVYGRYDYCARCGICRFAFDLVAGTGGVVLIYIIEQPSYGSRSGDGHATHRIFDGRRHYICIQSDLAPRTVPDALTWLTYWAEETCRYIQTGIQFS